MRIDVNGHSMYAYTGGKAFNPAQPTVVMIHGGGQTAVNFLGTPDGRRGWADYFVARGFAVYLVDQPGRGRTGSLSRQPRQTAG